MTIARPSLRFGLRRWTDRTAPLHGFWHFPRSGRADLRSSGYAGDRNGGPEELKLVEVEVGDPGPGEIRIRHKAIGLNFIDV